MPIQWSLLLNGDGYDLAWAAPGMQSCFCAGAAPHIRSTLSTHLPPKGPPSAHAMPPASSSPACKSHAPPFDVKFLRTIL